MMFDGQQCKHRMPSVLWIWLAPKTKTCIDLARLRKCAAIIWNGSCSIAVISVLIITDQDRLVLRCWWQQKLLYYKLAKGIDTWLMDDVGRVCIRHNVVLAKLICHSSCVDLCSVALLPSCRKARRYLNGDWEATMMGYTRNSTNQDIVLTKSSV